MDKKLSELTSAASIDAADISLLVHNNTDYQYSFATLLSFLSSNLSTGAAISFGTTLPQNTTGKNGDVFVNTTAGSFAQKISGTWNVVYTLPSGSTQNDGTVLYGLGIPTSATGLNNDTYINTTTGIFYKKTAGAWSPVFTMLNGPAGAKGDKGDKGDTGAAGRTILQGTVNPSNSTDGVNGDFYINTSTYTLFGPKTVGVWGSGINLIGPQGEKGDTGDTGPQGARGDAGEGVPTGGMTGQIISKTSDADYDTQWIDQQDISGKANNDEVVHLSGDESIGGNKTFNGVTEFNTTVKINYNPGIGGYQFEADGNSRLGGSIRFENTITMAGDFQVSKDSESMYFSGEGDILFVDEVSPIVPLSDVGYILAAKPHVAGNKLVKINKNSFPNVVTLVPYSGATETLDLNAQWLVGVGVFIAGHVNGSLGHFGANANVRSDEFGVVIGDQSIYNQPADNPMIKNMKGIGFGRETDGFTGYTYIQPYENVNGRVNLALSFGDYVFMGYGGVESLRLKFEGALQGGADYSSQVNETTYIQKAFINPKKLAGATVSFNRESIYGDLDTPITGNISFSPVTDPDAPQDIFGIVCQMIHNDATEPLYPSAFKKLSGSGDYVPGENNYIFCEYLSYDVILYNIQQAS